MFISLQKRGTLSRIFLSSMTCLWLWDQRLERVTNLLRFVYDHVFSPFPQRAYSDHCEKWELVVASLQHFHIYDSLPQIQRSSIKIMNILSSRLVGLVTMLIKINAANSLIEDYADCLDLRMEEGEAGENNSCDELELLVDNINRLHQISHICFSSLILTPLWRGQFCSLSSTTVV